MTSYEYAPSLAHIIQREAQALISALVDGDDVDAATTLATIAELVSAMQRWLSPDAIRIGVTHAPYTRVLDSMTHLGTELILAGHTHGGQIGLPGVTSLVTNCDLPREFGKGLHVWETGVNECSWLHVSAGLGTSPYAKVRIATRPEVSILTIHD